METIRTYTNTKCELEMAKARLNLLMDRKEQLYAKFFPVTQRLKDDIVKGGEQDSDKFANYLYELYNVDIGTGKSLADEIEYQRAVVNKLNGYIDTMNEALSKMTGIEYELYYAIVVKGIKISRAVSGIAEEYGVDDQTVWKYNYRKIKKEVKKVKKYSESTVNCVV